MIQPTYPIRPTHLLHPNSSALRQKRGRSIARLLILPVLLLFTASAFAQFSGPRTLTNPINNLPEPAPTTDRAILYPPAHDLIVKPGDLLNIKVFLQADYTVTTRVGTDGAVNLPLLGEVMLAGLSIRQAARFIDEKLVAGGFFLDPQASLEVTDSPNSILTFTGELHQVVNIIGTRRLLDVISVAGGLPGSASHSITIHRPGVPDPIIVDLGVDPLSSQLADVPVFAGDTIVVSRIGSVYMTGSFKTPSSISLTPYSPLTLLQATAISGGFNQDAKFQDLRIIRTIGDRRTVVKINAHDVLYGKAPDPYLQPGDIVFLPNSAIKTAFYNGSIGTVLGLASLVISFALYR